MYILHIPAQQYTIYCTSNLLWADKLQYKNYTFLVIPLSRGSQGRCSWPQLTLVPWATKCSTMLIVVGSNSICSGRYRHRVNPNSKVVGHNKQNNEPNVAVLNTNIWILLPPSCWDIFFRFVGFYQLALLPLTENSDLWLLQKRLLRSHWDTSCRSKSYKTHKTKPLWNEWPPVQTAVWQWTCNMKEHVRWHINGKQCP